MTSIPQSRWAQIPHHEEAWQRPSGDNGYRQTALAFLLAAGLSLPFLGAGSLAVYSTISRQAAAARAVEAERTALPRLLAAAPAAAIPSQDALHGRAVFMTTCVACHGATGEGVDGLGKDLVHSGFVASRDDAALLAFLHSGRAANAPENTTKIPMPPKGGREDLTDKDLGAVVLYMRGLQDPRRMPELPAYEPPKAGPPTADEKAAALAAAGGDAELAEYIASGAKLFASSCASCHGPDAKGLKGNGKDLVDSTFVRGLDDEALLAFIKKGRDPGDPANTTGVGMPAKGGNPALSEDDLLDVISFIRSRNAPASK